MLYAELVEFIIRVIDHIMAAHEVLRKKVRGAMGGEILELMHERAERLEREAEQRGIEQGLEQGLEQGVDALSNILRECGVDKAIIEEAAKAALEGRRG